MTDLFAAFVEIVASKVAEKVLTRLGPAPPGRVRLSHVVEHGAPSPRWVREQARAGKIEIRGPRGARYVDGAELAALLASTSIQRRPEPPRESGVDLMADAKAAVLDLAARRGRRAS